MVINKVYVVGYFDNPSGGISIKKIFSTLDKAEDFISCLFDQDNSLEIYEHNIEL